jgi:hypothetical protein
MQGFRVAGLCACAAVSRGSTGSSLVSSPVLHRLAAIRYALWFKAVFDGLCCYNTRLQVGSPGRDLRFLSAESLPVSFLQLLRAAHGPGGISSPFLPERHLDEHSSRKTAYVAVDERLRRFVCSPGPAIEAADPLVRLEPPRYVAQARDRDMGRCAGRIRQQ